MSDTHATARARPPLPKSEFETAMDYNNLKISDFLKIIPENKEPVRKTIRASIKGSNGIWDTHKIVLVTYPGLSVPEIGAGRTRYQCGKDVEHIFTAKDFHLKTFPTSVAAEEWIITEGARRNMDDDQQDQLIIELINLHPDWGHKRIAGLAGVSHMTIKRARHKMKAVETQKKKEATDAENKKTQSYNNLVKAWGDADDEAQERFVSDYKIDLADMLRMG